MKKIAPVLSGMILLCSTCMLYGQPIHGRALKKGDTLPALPLLLRTCDKVDSVNLKDYKGKLLLLDFWGVHCADCIASLPHMVELQKQFRDRVKILVVTEDSNEQVDALWKRFSKSPVDLKWVKAGQQLPFVTGDTLLSSMFPHTVLPTHVWIDTNQALKAIAYNKSTTASNIQAYFEGKDPPLMVQNYFDLNLDAPLTWFRDAIADDKKTPYYSFITDHIEYGNGGRHIVKDLTDPVTGAMIGITCINCSVLDLYKIAYKDQMHIQGNFPDSRLIVETKDSTKFFPLRSSYTSWARQKSYCYAFKQTPCTTETVYARMKFNLDQFFHLSSRVEKRRVLCWVLKQTGNADKIKTRGGPEKYESGGSLFLMQNMDIQNLFFELKNVISVHDANSICLDETRYKGKIDIRLPWNRELANISLSGLRRSLQNYGLDLVREFREIDMLVIRDN